MYKWRYTRKRYNLEPWSGWSSFALCTCDVGIACQEGLLGWCCAQNKGTAQKQKDSLNYYSRTAYLWLLYMDMVNILRKLLRSEHTGYFTLHIAAISEMFPFMAASRHNVYTKSVRIYVQQMCECTGFRWNIQMSTIYFNRDTMWSDEVIAYIK